MCTGNDHFTASAMSSEGDRDGSMSSAMGWEFLRISQRRQKRMYHGPGSSVAYLDVDSERASQSNPGHSRSTHSLCSTYISSLSQALHSWSVLQREKHAYDLICPGNWRVISARDINGKYCATSADKSRHNAVTLLCGPRLVRVAGAVSLAVGTWPVE